MNQLVIIILIRGAHFAFNPPKSERCVWLWQDRQQQQQHRMMMEKKVKVEYGFAYFSIKSFQFVKRFHKMLKKLGGCGFKAARRRGGLDLSTWFRGKLAVTLPAKWVKTTHRGAMNLRNNLHANFGNTMMMMIMAGKVVSKYVHKLFMGRRWWSAA